jgi:hypothetical protein
VWQRWAGKRRGVATEEGRLLCGSSLAGLGMGDLTGVLLEPAADRQGFYFQGKFAVLWHGFAAFFLDLFGSASRNLTPQ